MLARIVLEGWIVFQSRLRRGGACFEQRGSAPSCQGEAGGGDASHGAKGWRRRSGAIGQRLFPGTVMRGMRMPGHMGQVRVTTQNLEVIQVRDADNVLLVKGAVPGSKGEYVIIRESKTLPKGSPAAAR